MSDEKDVMTEEQEEAEEIELNAEKNHGDVRDNPMNTRKNHVITAIWLLLLVAVLASVDYANRLCETEAEELMAVLVDVQCEGAYGVSVEYGLNRKPAGGQVCQQVWSNDPEMTIPLPRGDSLRFAFTQWDIGEGRSIEDGLFCMQVGVLLADQSERILEDLWEWQAVQGGEYHFTLSGDAESGFALTAGEGETAYTVTPLSELAGSAIQ